MVGCRSLAFLYNKFRSPVSEIVGIKHNRTTSINQWEKGSVTKLP